MIHSNDTKKRLSYLSKQLPQLIILIGPKGSGKENIINELSHSITSPSNITNILPLENKKTIGIEQIRDLKKASYLTKNEPQIIAIPNAEALTIEAQNSMLKLLEDTPKNLHIIMGTTSIGKILKTIRSRAHQWRIVNPNEPEIIEFYSGKNELAKIKEAMIVTAKKARYLEEFITDNKSPVNIEQAKEILSEDKFHRLQRVNVLSKDQPQALEIIEALIVICKAATEMAAQQDNYKKVSEWKNRLNECLIAIDFLEKSVQPKLVLTKLFMVL